MINESPDKLILKGKKLTWHDGITFFAFKTPGGKTHIAISHGATSDFHMQINEIDLSDYIKKNHPGFMTYLDHESMAAVIYAIKPDIIKEKMNREEFEFSGRMWEENGKNYFSFWNEKPKIEKNRPLLDRLVSLLKVKFDNSLFEFPQNQGDYKPYDQVMRTVEPPKKDMEKFMSQLHTLPPGAKKWAMRGLSMREALVSESPDEIYTEDLFGDTDEDNEMYDWESHEINSVFSVFYDFNDAKYIVAKCINGKPYKITTGDSQFDSELGLDKFLKDVKYTEIVHDTLLKPLGKLLPMGNVAHVMPRERTEVSGRSWLIRGTNIFSFWNRQSVVKKFKTQMDEIMSQIGATTIDSKFESIDRQGEFKTYNEFFSGVEKKSKMSDAQIRDLMKKQHLDPRAKKILHMIATGGDYSDVMQSTAASLNMTLSQLRNKITQGD